MRPICLLIALVVAVQSAPAGPVTFKELPCLNKLAGQRLPNPENPHQFLRCVTADSAWIETCPDNLFYNPHSQICDWDTLEKATPATTTPLNVKFRPMLVKFKPVSSGEISSRTLVSGMETTVIQDVDSFITPPPNSVLTTKPPMEPIVESIATTTIAAPIVVPSTSMINFVVPSEQAAPALEVITTTPMTQFVQPTAVPVVEPVHVPTVTPVMETIVVPTTIPEFIVPTTTPAALVFEMPKSEQPMMSVTTPVATFVHP
jgi:hypothetical protein